MARTKVEPFKTEANFTLDAHHQFRLYDGVHSGGSDRITDTDGFDPRKRTVIILPGTRVNHEMPDVIVGGKFVPSYRDYVRESLELEGITDAKTYCGVYGHNDEQMISDHYSQPTRKDQDLEVRPFTNDIAGTDVRRFVQNVLLPMSGVKEHTHPNAEAVAKRLANLTFVAHSYGGTFADELAREFQYVLRNDHGYSRAEAAYITSEVVKVGFAPVRDVKHERNGFRNIDFIGRTDASNLGFMRRVAADHIRNGLVAEDTKVEELAQYYYHRSGYLDLPNTLLPPETAWLDAPEVIGSSQVIRAAMPPAIHWETEAGTPQSMDQARLDAEHRKIEKFTRAIRRLPEPTPGNEQASRIVALNGEDLVQYGLVPTHDHRMYLQLADENQELVHTVRRAIAASVLRLPQSRNIDPLESTADLVKSALTPGISVKASQLEARVKPVNETRIS